MKKKKPIVNQMTEFPEGERPFASWEKIKKVQEEKNISSKKIVVKYVEGKRD